MKELNLWSMVNVCEGIKFIKGGHPIQKPKWSACPSPRLGKNNFVHSLW